MIRNETILAALQAHGNNRAAAARSLGMPLSTLRWRKLIPPDTPKPNRATDPATREVVDMIERSGLTQSEVADRAGISDRTIRDWRAGIRPGRPEFLEWVREALS